ncbi:hypothetical protein OG897_36485 [Streptomyces sp. NBC_00237]|uniref:hypothetical protein n=1 Tax=Streptomyces sp. NBC_00237 TaxID=2975687 RepID=UPI00225AEEBC|nr:hypothetical protein [Streptomyces sp. NBC_00237]MCX5206886.1 hypothetical protein [Streptomyces sp. NBC_00237]
MAKLTEEQRARRAATRARRKALAAEESHRQDRERSARWRREGKPLSWAEYIAGVPCRGCGEPMHDGRGNRPSLANLTKDQRSDYEALEERFQQRHADCQGGRWGISESWVSHCFQCCPTPPMSPQQWKTFLKLTSSGPSPEERKKYQDAWELTLTCDHVITFAQHRDNTYAPALAMCPDCNTHRGVIHSERIGPAHTDDGVPMEREQAKLARLTDELAQAKKVLLRQKKQLNESKSRIEEIEKDLRSAHGASTET